MFQHIFGEVFDFQGDFQSISQMVVKELGCTPQIFPNFTPLGAVKG